MEGIIDRKSLFWKERRGRGGRFPYMDYWIEKINELEGE